MNVYCVKCHCWLATIIMVQGEMGFHFDPICNKCLKTIQNKLLDDISTGQINNEKWREFVRNNLLKEKKE